MDLAEIRFRNEARAEKVRKSAEDLATYIEASDEFEALLKDNHYSHRFSDLPKALRCFRWAWPLTLESVSLPDLDRRKPLLGGPLFTSALFPWPSDLAGLLQPIAQIDLDHAHELSGVQLGRGYLQIWTNAFGDKSQLRVVPREHIESAELARIPEGLEEAENLKYAFSAVMMDWEKASWANAQQITGIEEKILTWPSSLYDLLSDFHDMMSGRLAAFIGELLQELPESSPTPTPHLFGNFREIQYTCQERAPCLLSLDSDDPFCWGDNGSAQVFYDPVRRRIDTDGFIRVPFWFEWSCG